MCASGVESTRGGGISCIGSALMVTPISASSFLHEAVYEPSNQLLGVVDLHSFLTAECWVTGDSHLQHADDVGCVCMCDLERDPRTVFWISSLYILQASTCPVQTASYESHRLVLTVSGDALICCIVQFAHSWQSSYHDTRRLHVLESVCSAELEAVFGICDRTTAVLGMHCNPHAQCF